MTKFVSLMKEVDLDLVYGDYDVATGCMGLIFLKLMRIRIRLRR